MLKFFAVFACALGATLSYGQFELTLNKSAVAGQNFVQGTITLDSPSDSSTVFTTYDNSSLVSTPATVTVPASTTTRAFSISVTAVNSQINTTVYARLGSVTKSQPLALIPLVPTALAFTPNPVAGGMHLVGRVVVNGVAGPGGRVISIFDNSAYSDLPSSVTVPPGGTDAYFTITTKHVTNIQTVTVTAVVSAGAKSGTFRIVPNGFIRAFRFANQTDTIQLKGGTWDGACDLRQNFTVEAVFRPTNVAFGCLWQQWHNSTMNEAIYLDPNNTYFIGTGSGGPTNRFYAGQLTPNAWVHVAWVRDGYALRVYRNGQLYGTTNRSAQICPLDTAQAAAIGKNGGTPFATEPSFIGDLASFRISSVARYTGSSFLPPAGPWTVDSDTLMLINPSLITEVPDSMALPGTAGIIANPGVGGPTSTAPTLVPYTP